MPGGKRGDVGLSRGTGGRLNGEAAYSECLSSAGFCNTLSKQIGWQMLEHSHCLVIHEMLFLHAPHLAPPCRLIVARRRSWEL